MRPKRSFILRLFPMFLSLILLILSQNTSAKKYNGSGDNPVPPVQTVRMQGNLINAAYKTNGIIHGADTTSFIWPVSAPAINYSLVYSSGLWIGAKVVLSGNQKDLRLAAASYSSHYSPGNIPIIGQVPPLSVCNDTIWRAYYVQLTDSTLVNGGVRYKMAGGQMFTFTYDAWSAWPVNLGAPFVEVNNIPGYQPGWNSDRPGIGNSAARPVEILFTTYMDYTNCTNNLHPAEISLPGGSLPLGVEIQQLVFYFSCSELQNAVFLKWKVINKSSRTWDSTYFSYFTDSDVGWSYDDASGCDSVKETGYMFNADNIDPIYGFNPPAIGYRLLQGPLIYTGNQNDTAKLPYDTLIGYKLLRLSGFNVTYNGSIDPCLNDPDYYIAGYDFMRGLDGCARPIINPITNHVTTFKFSGNACTGTGWLDQEAEDKRLLFNMGPFTMNSQDTQIVVIGCFAGRGSSNHNSVCVVQNDADLGKELYYSGFCVNPPIGINDPTVEIPYSFKLYQNYPNPFNPVTKIQFAVPLNKGGERGLSVKLTIYDALGREVATLVNNKLQPGTYEVEWDGTNYPSGVYFYILSSEEYTETKKMVILK